eukprot:TRINITY_DN6412_c1_g1_i12.p2 TRINITY_DN6412_c1_g1~~TRINITY_DN6412_c1_g1_i12.p2  ORF type:complete len:138 (-),score=3.71 TRINITY_DN6412_c1_g1_i12:53-466(-)
MSFCWFVGVVRFGGFLELTRVDYDLQLIGIVRLPKFYLSLCNKLILKSIMCMRMEIIFITYVLMIIGVEVFYKTKSNSSIMRYRIQMLSKLYEILFKIRSNKENISISKFLFVVKQEYADVDRYELVCSLQHQIEVG